MKTNYKEILTQQGEQHQANREHDPEEKAMTVVQYKNKQSLRQFRQRLFKHTFGVDSNE